MAGRVGMFIWKWHHYTQCSAEKGENLWEFISYLEFSNKKEKTKWKK